MLPCPTRARFNHVSRKSIRRLATKASAIASVPVVRHPSVEHFRDAYFDPERPVAFPDGQFASLPAVRRWFKQYDDGTAELNTYLRDRGGEVNVPLELTRCVPHGASGTPSTEFQRFEAPLSMFLDAMARTAGSDWDREAGPWLYLAQCPLYTLPLALQDDLPMPDIVRYAGKGDVYDSSIWLGRAPTYTSLHKDPNPNLFVQLAGRKRVRLTTPHQGSAIYQEARRSLGQSTGQSSMRGEEMMAGSEKELLKKWVWENDGHSRSELFVEAVLEAGDGLFIPKGWWHSIESFGLGMTASVNWWFR